MKGSNKFKVFIALFVVIVLVMGSSYAVWRYYYNGTGVSSISSTDLSFRFLESNKDVISIDSGIPMTDKDGINQNDSGNVFDFEVKSKALASTDVKYVVSLEKLDIDSGKTALGDSDVKIYVEDFNGNTVLKPTKISDLDNYKLFEKLNRHSKSNSEISNKYKLKVWIDDSVDVFSLENKQYKFKINVKTDQQEQNKDQTYKLVYNLDGGSSTSAISDSSFKVGDKVTITSVVPVKEGYEFLGWSTKKNDSTSKYNAGDSVTFNDAYDGTVTLYAVWNKNITYTVKYNPNGGILPATFTSSGTYPWIETDGVYKSGNYNINSSTSTMKSEEFTLTETGDISFDWAVSSESASYDYLYYTIYKDGTALSGTGTSTKIGGYSSSDTENNLTYKTVTKTLEAGTYTIEFSYRKDSSTHKGLDRGYVKNLIVPGYGENNTMDDSTFGSGINKLSKNRYVKPHYIFKGWSLSDDATSAIYQDGQEVDSLTEKDNDIVNLYAVWEANKYTVNVVVQNGTVDTAEKQIEYNKNGTFNLTSSIEGAIGSVTCTNGQTGKVENNILTVSNVSADTTCTVSFKDTFTTLYEDGTLIINESAKNRNTNITTHGNITKEYDPMSDSNSYVMDLNTQPWGNETTLIKNVEIGQKMEPISTQYWFYDLTNMSKGDFSNLDTSSVTNMSNMFQKAGENATTWTMGGLSNWDVSKVTDMSDMFYYAGKNAPTWTIGDLSKWNTSSVTKMNSMFYDAGIKATTWTIGDLSNWDVSKVTDMSSMFYYAGSNATTFNLNLSNWDTSKVTDMSDMFSDAGSNTTTFNLDLSKWNTSSVTNMSNMFYYAGMNATTWSIGDLSNWDTSSVTNMNYMFELAGYKAETFELYLSNWDTSKVTLMKGMFNSAGMNATTWTIGDLSNWDVSKVTDMSSMFATAGYNAATFNLNLSKWNISSVTKMNSMFFYTGKYATTWSVTIPKTTGSLTNTTSKWYGSSESVYASPPSGESFTLPLIVDVVVQDGTLASGEKSSKNGRFGENVEFNIVPNDTSKAGVVSCTNGQTGSFASNVLTVNNVTNDTTCTVSFVSVSTVLYNDGTLIINELSSNRDSNISTHGSVTKEYDAYSNSNSYVFASGSNQPWKGERASIKSVNIGNNIKPISTAHWFYNLENMGNANFASLDTSSVIDMSNMFRGTGGESSNLEFVGLSNWDTSNVTDMSYMFAAVGFSSTTWSIGDISSWNTSKVINMSNMFEESGDSTTAWSIGDLSNWDTSNVRDMSYMFQYAGENSTTWSIGDLSRWDTSQVTDMSYMFSNADGNSTTWSIGDLSRWDTSKVTNMRMMFESVIISNLDLSNWNTSKVTNMSGMFYNASYNAATLDLDLSRWDTSQVTDMSRMFYYTGYNATTWSIGDISGWDTSKVANMEGMFGRAGYNATTFDLDLSGWNTSNVTSMNTMFYNTGYNATTWSIGDISGWDTSNVTSMRNMFKAAGYKATTFDLDLSNWDTSNVTSMNTMFNAAGYNAKTFDLDLSSWNTSSVINMTDMFVDAGLNSSNWRILIPVKSGSTINTKDKFYGFRESVFGTPDTDREFTIFSKPVNINVVVQNGTITDDSLKSVFSGNSVTFSLASDDSSLAAFVDCTNNQHGTYNNGVLTIDNVTDDTVCTIKFDTAVTTLYEDGTLIVNELASDRDNNVVTYGSVVNEYDAFSDNNSYVMDSSSAQPWYGEAIASVKIGANIKPISTANWFSEVTFETGDFAKLDTSEVIDMSSMFNFAGVGREKFVLTGLEHWDTSKVTNMGAMFAASGVDALLWNIGNLSNWKFDNIDNMEAMFANAGYNATDFHSIGRLNFVNCNNNIIMSSFALDSPSFTANILFDNPYFNSTNDMFTGSAISENASVTIYYDYSNSELDSAVQGILENYGSDSHIYTVDISR